MTASSAPQPAALVLAAFGAADLPARAGLDQVLRQVREAFPACHLAWAFFSGPVRALWRQRAADPAWAAAHPDTPPEYLAAASPLATLGRLHDQGFRQVVVQPLQLTAGEEYLELAQLTRALAAAQGLRPGHGLFTSLALGRPALGLPDPRHPYQVDLERAARALDPQVAEARENHAALVYVGHGNPLWDGGPYRELEDVLRARHPHTPLCVGTLSGSRGQGAILRELAVHRATRVILRPLLLIAGRHARHDICGPEPTSWASALAQAGLAVDSRPEGLGENPAWASIYPEHLADAAREAGVELG
ncbi:MAG: sirohydrochlorin cobaltochelatase [Deltaproteobacteria bacterium]|nr:sirohydrochlorin cobaltochelatase [Deltaproteobacteria bacterium]